MKNCGYLPEILPVGYLQVRDDFGCYSSGIGHFKDIDQSRFELPVNHIAIDCFDAKLFESFGII